MITTNTAMHVYGEHTIHAHAWKNAENWWKCHIINSFFYNKSITFSIILSMYFLKCDCIGFQTVCKLAQSMCFNCMLCSLWKTSEWQNKNNLFSSCTQSLHSSTSIHQTHFTEWQLVIGRFLLGGERDQMPGSFSSINERFRQYRYTTKQINKSMHAKCWTMRENKNQEFFHWHMKRKTAL